MRLELPPFSLMGLASGVRENLSASRTTTHPRKLCEVFCARFFQACIARWEERTTIGERGAHFCAATEGVVYSGGLMSRCFCRRGLRENQNVLPRKRLNHRAELETLRF